MSNSFCAAPKKEEKKNLFHYSYVVNTFSGLLFNTYVSKILLAPNIEVQ